LSWLDSWVDTYIYIYISRCSSCYVNTDINCHTGPMTHEEAAKGPVKCALLLDGGSTICYFDQNWEVASFWPSTSHSDTRFTLDHGCCEKTPELIILPDMLSGSVILWHFQTLQHNHTDKMGLIPEHIFVSWYEAKMPPWSFQSFFEIRQLPM
jgi:hypothetical protein